MFIDDQTYTRDGKTYRRALLRNSYRKNGKVCHDTIANLSKCPPEEIAAIKWGLANVNNPEFLAISGKRVGSKQGLIVGAVWLLYQIAKRLGIVSALGRNQKAKLCLWLTISCLIGSVSRLSATRLAQCHAACDILGPDSFCEDDLYLAMDWLHKNQGKIEQHIFNRRYKAKKPNLYLYDVTSSYFEGNRNELGEYGYNRDGKKGKKQIVVGLLTDETGWPISCEVFKGNTNDTKTFKNQILKVAESFGAKRVTFVGDRGMIKSTQINDLSEEKFHYITALTKVQIESMLKKGMIQMGLFDNMICEVENDGIRYILRRNPHRAEEIRQVRQSKSDKLQKLVSDRTKYLADHPRAKVETAIRACSQMAKKLKTDKWTNIYAQERVITADVDPELLANEEKLDGCYVIKTDLSLNTADMHTIHDRYKSLSEVEWAFGTMKTTLLHMRGIYVRKDNRTRAHVFTIMLAYMLAYELRRLWTDMEVTIDEAIQELSSLCATEIVIGNFSIQTIPEPRKQIKLLFEKAQVTLPDALPCRNINVYTRKKLVGERNISINSG